MGPEDSRACESTSRCPAENFDHPPHGAQSDESIKVLEALKVDKQQEIISSTLDAIYVQRMAVQTYRRLAGSSNKTVMVLPNTAQGTGLPQVLPASESRELSDEDRAPLDEMEKRYMKMASEAIEGGDVELPKV